MLGTSEYFDQRAAGNVAAQLRTLLPSNALVVRDGKEITLPASDVVLGDVVHLVLGSRVPADLKVIQTKDLKLDFSSLTGESDPIPMSITALDDKVHESKNIAFMSSQVCTMPRCPTQLVRADRNQRDFFVQCLHVLPDMATTREGPVH